MRTLSATVAIAALTCPWVLGDATRAAAHAQEAIPDRAAALTAFATGVEQYAAVRARLEAPLPPFADDRRSAWSRHLQGHYLASALRVARRHAAVGDIFTPAVAAIFRQDITRAVYEIDIEGLADEGTEAHLVDLTVNEPVPEWAMRPVPIALLERLAPLPGAIEYRLVGDALILWDVHAGILIDALPGAFVDS